MRNGVGRLLELQDLEVDALALVGEDEEGVEGTVGAPSLLRVALPGEGVALEARFDAKVWDGGAAGPALDRDAGGLGLDAGGGHNNAGDLDHLGDVAAHEGADGDTDLVAAQGHVDVL